MSQKSDYLKLVKLYQNKTGRMDFTSEHVAEWAEQHMAIEMPVPPSPKELLAQKISRAMGSERRCGSNSGNAHRGTLSYRTLRNGQIEYRWFDIDGPAATPESVAQSLSMRRDKAVDILAQTEIDRRYWSAVNPRQPLPAIDCDLTDEVAWRVNADADDGDADERQAG